MAKRRQKKDSVLEELEAAIEDTSEDRLSKEADAGSSRRKTTGRRAARFAKVEQERRRKKIRWAIISVLIAVVVVIAAVGIWYVTRPGENPVVVFETRFGPFEVEIYTDECPITAGNFEKLVKEDFYNGLLFHRIIAGFMIQGGDPAADGTGGPGYSIEAEDSALALKHDYGVISMANSGSPDTAGSQFFIVVAEDGYHSLDGKYAVFGKVVSGMDAVVTISRQPVTDNGQGEDSKPVNNIHMDRVHIK